MKFIWHNIILGIFVNIFVAPIAYIFRNKLKADSFLWGFLTDNPYGDKTWRPKLKNKFLRAYLWMIRNPRQNWYWKDWIDGRETDFKGVGKIKFGHDILSWRTMICSDTEDWHGKVLDFQKSRFGTQNITFIRTDINGNVQNCYRKSTCKPYRILNWIVLVKRRSGHEAGLMQYNFTFPIFRYNLCKAGWEKWNKTDWKTITI